MILVTYNSLTKGVYTIITVYLGDNVYASTISSRILYQLLAIYNFTGKVGDEIQISARLTDNYAIL